MLPGGLPSSHCYYIRRTCTIKDVLNELSEEKLNVNEETSRVGVIKARLSRLRLFLCEIFILVNQTTYLSSSFGLGMNLTHSRF